jgi:hypothetical protein
MRTLRPAALLGSLAVVLAQAAGCDSEPPFMDVVTIDAAAGGSDGSSIVPDATTDAPPADAGALEGGAPDDLLAQTDLPVDGDGLDLAPADAQPPDGTPPPGDAAPDAGAAVLVIEPSLVTFPTTAPAARSEPRTFTVSNRGSAASGPVSIELPASGPFAVESSTCSAPLAPGETCQIRVSFAPAQIGSSAVGLLVSAGPAGTATAVVAGHGSDKPPTPGVASLAVTPFISDFDAVLVGTQSPPRTIVVENVGGATSPRPVVSLSGSAFRIVDDGCTAPLPSETSCTIVLAFAPLASGYAPGSLTIVAGEVSGLVQLSGTGVWPVRLSWTPPAQNFGDVEIGRERGPIHFTLRHDSGIATTRPTIRVSDGFAIASDACAAVATLAPGQSCEVSVVFSPGALGTRSGTLTATTPDTEATAALYGRGVPKNVPVLLPNTLTFEPLTVGKESAPQVFKVVNTGSSALNALHLALTGSADFGLSSLCQATLEAGSSCDVHVTFKPSSPGAHASAVAVTYSDGSTMADLTGTGL